MNSSRNDVRADAALAHLLLRVILGVNITIHGLSRIASGPATFTAELVHGFAKTPLPPALVAGFATALPWLEAVVGAFIVLGLFSRFAFVAGMLLMLALTFGSSLEQNWNAAGQQLLYALVYAVVLAGASFDRYSLDALLARGRHASEATIAGARR